MPDNAPPSQNATRLVCNNTAIPPIGGVSMAGFIRDSAGISASPMRILGRYAVVYVLHGRGIYRQAGGASVAVRPGDLITVVPDVPHAYHPNPGQRWDEFYIVFDGPAFHPWRDAGLIGAGEKAVRHLEPIEYWLRRLVAAAGDSIGGDLAAGLAGVCRMQQLLADIVTANDLPEDRAWLARARAMIDDEVAHAGADLAAVAGRLDMGYDAFRKRFRKLAGQSPGRYCAGRVMDRACDLLADPNATLREVAEGCGFCDEFHFSRRFKQMVGMPPTEFRRRLPG
jgi:AraC-like DNA-binding protein